VTEPISADPMSSDAAELGRSAATEWSNLVATAVLGTDRRPAPAPLPGWDAWAIATDPAVAVLDRAAAVVVARRAGACPEPAPIDALPTAPVDTRPTCPPPCALRLVRLLAGEHDLLLPEWFARCEAAGVQLPWVSLPALLLRGRRHPHLDQAVRRVAGPRAAWLADVVPELGVKRTAAAITSSSPPFTVPPQLPDGGAAVSAIAQVFHDGLATWAAAPQLRLAVASLPPDRLPSLVVELSRLSFSAVTERTRADLLRLVEFRAEMLREWDRAAE
jgi:hypothetical protein